MNCKDCKHWESGVALMGFRSCGKLSADYGNPYTYKNPPSDDVKALVIKGLGMSWEHEGDFMTAPDFGCNQFEKDKDNGIKI